MAALLEVLDSIADALAAQWDLGSEAARIEVAWNGGDEPPIRKDRLILQFFCPNGRRDPPRCNQ